MRDVFDLGAPLSLPGHSLKQNAQHAAEKVWIVVFRYFLGLVVDILFLKKKAMQVADENTRHRKQWLNKRRNQKEMVRSFHDEG